MAGGGRPPGGPPHPPSERPLSRELGLPPLSLDLSPFEGRRESSLSVFVAFGFVTARARLSSEAVMAMVFRAACGMPVRFFVCVLCLSSVSIYKNVCLCMSFTYVCA